MKIVGLKTEIKEKNSPTPLRTNAGSVKSGISLNVNETNIQTLDSVSTINAIQFGCKANNL